MIPTPNPPILYLTEDIPDSYTKEGFSALVFTNGTEVTGARNYKIPSIEHNLAVIVEFHNPEHDFYSKLSRCCNDTKSWSFKVDINSDLLYFSARCLEFKQEWPDNIVKVVLELDSNAIMDAIKTKQLPKRVRDW